MYITYEEYLRWYDSPENSAFPRFAFEACRILDKYTAGIDGFRKLREAFPTDEQDAETVKFTAAQLVHALCQIAEVEQSAALGRGYAETAQGMRGKVIASVSAGNESVSYSTGATDASTAFESAALDNSAKEKLLAEIVRSGLSGLSDANGVNLLYMGVYPRRGAECSVTP